MVTIKRRAADPSGRIGFFYDECEDRIIESSGINFETHEVHQPIECVVEKGGNIASQNLLRFIGFDDEHRLSLLSNIIPPMGIASVIEYPYLIDECTRVLYYSYTIQQQHLPSDTSKIKKKIQQSAVEAVATHIITKIDMGIDVIVIMRFTSDRSWLVDDTLDKIKQCLTNNTTLPKNVSLDETLSTHVYSNIPDLTKQKTLLDVYHEIEKVKMTPKSYRPLIYSLHPIEAFLSNENKKHIISVSLKPALAQKIEEYLLRFSWINKMRAATLDDKTFKLLNR